MKNEADVKKAVKKILDKHGAYWFMPVPTGYGVQGVPDFIVCVAGKFIAIETKFGKNKLTTYQEKHRENIQKANGVHLVITELTISTLDSMLTGVKYGNSAICV